MTRQPNPHYHPDRLDFECPFCEVQKQDKKISDLQAQLTAANEKVRELEKQLVLIGDRAVVDFDDPTVGLVDAVVPKQERYRDWLKAVNDMSKQLTAQAATIEKLRGALKVSLNHWKHYSYDHEYIKDENRCLECKRKKEYEALQSET